jgi:sugar phosphate isomerase/epimerase
VAGPEPNIRHIILEAGNDMRYCYAHRKFTLYPQSVDSWNLAPENYTDEFLHRVKESGFDALEVGAEVLDRLGEEAGIKEFARRIEGFGLKIGALRSGGTLLEAQHGPANREKLDRAIKYAGWTGAEVVNGALSAPLRYPTDRADQAGWPKSQDASRDQMLSLYDDLAKVYQGFCDSAADVNVNISIEVHQNSPVDNSWSAKLIHAKIDRPNFGINPDVGNVVWVYDKPEETFDGFMAEVAPISNYWHSKNLVRVHHPENNRTVFLRVPLPDGEVDYRFAISAMADSGFSGYMAIEGAATGDQWTADKKSLDYAKSIWAEVEKPSPAGGNGARMRTA